MHICIKAGNSIALDDYSEEYCLLKRFLATANSLLL